MRGVTWVRDSHGLFDYESKSNTKKSWSTTQQAKIVRAAVEHEIKMVPMSYQENMGTA